MDCKEERVDVRIMDPEAMSEAQKQNQLTFELNHTMPGTEEYNRIMRELFKDHIGGGSIVSAPVSGAAFYKVDIGENVFINSNVLLMGRGGITIEDNVMIAANAQIISNNHDPYNLMVLTCKPVLICEGAGVGAGK